jgi:hypothetical protein
MRIGVLHHGTEYQALPCHRQDQRLIHELQERGMEAVGFSIKDPSLGVMKESGAYRLFDRTTRAPINLAGLGLSGVINRNHPDLGKLSIRWTSCERLGRQTSILPRILR